MKVVRIGQPHERRSRWQASAVLPGVEGLEARRALAAGVVAAPLAVPLQVAGQPIATVDPAAFDLPPTPGRPVPVASLVSSSGALTPSGFAATINWGDGTRPNQASIVALATGSLVVQGPDHTYARPGHYLVKVAIQEPGDSVPTRVQTKIDVSAPDLPLSGQLATASNSGAATTEGVTNTLTPTFTGSTQPGARVVVRVVPSLHPDATPTTIGTTTANAAGTWSVTSRRLAVGSYLVTAQATGSFRTTTTAPLRTNQIVPSIPFSYANVNNILIVQSGSTTVTGANGPRITSFALTDAQQGTFQIGYTDANPAGLNLNPLLAATNYSATLATGPRSTQSLTIAGLYNNAPATLNPLPVIVRDVNIVGRIGDGTTPLPRNATITLTVNAAAMTDANGVALDGEYTGKYPTGNGTPGGNFEVRITLRNGRVAGITRV